jgi:hypothetical protein
MIQVKIFNSSGLWKMKNARTKLNEFLRTVAEEDVVRIKRINSDKYMLIFKTKQEETN